MELTQAQVDRRADRVLSGTYSPELPGLHVVFVRMSLADKGESSRAYSSRLKSLIDEGGFFSDYAIPSVLRKVCQDNGLDLGAVTAKRKITERLYNAIPPEYQTPYDNLTEDEIALLPDEARADRQRGVTERGQRITEWLTAFYTDEERTIIAEAEQIEQLESHLRANTIEHQARKHQMETEILRGVRCAEQPEQHYFSDIEEIQSLPPALLTQLYMRWRQWRDGNTENFTSPSLPNR
ncbi:hypothetical protein KQR54_18750 [Mycobacterium gordonae]|nr:hypothetical protein [Mycobacterium gordonae]